ncbi:MAG: LysR family transcriptional regulator [Burkholderiales bacterium]|nr:LysR family transcriptional regulator [Burkholderiales bacterium]
MPQPRIRHYLRHGTLPQLAVFEASARLKSFTRAGDELHLAQPTVSAQIRKLTETVGTPLFEQVGRTLRLTAAGHCVHEHCLEILAVLSHLEESLQSLREVASGDLRLAIAGTTMSFVTRMIATFGARHPDVAITVRIDNRTRMLERLAAREDDLYLFADPPEAGDIVRQAVLAHPLVVVAAPSHPRCRARGLTLADLAGEPLVVRERGSGTRARIAALFAQAGVAPNVRMELASDDAVREAVRHGAGLGIVPRDCAMSGSGRDELVELDVAGFPLVRHWHFAYAAQARLTPAAGAFLQHVREAMQESEARAERIDTPVVASDDLYATRPAALALARRAVATSVLAARPT